MRQHLRLVGWVIAALVALPTGSSAQKVAPTASSDPVPVFTVQEKEVPDLKLDWQIRPRPPISFTPFEMIDPSTGKPVQAEDIIEINGVKMTAGEYYRRLNATEQWLNAHGYSLFKDEPIEFYSPRLEQEIADSEKRLRELEAQMPLDGEPLQTDTFYPASCSGDGRWFDTGWFGNALYGIRFVGQGSYQVCPTSVSIAGEAKLYGHIVGIGGEIASARGHAHLSAPENAPISYNYHFNVQVFGHTLWAPSGSGSWGYSQQWRWRAADIHWFADVPLACIWFFVPICVYGRIGVIGGLDVSTQVSLNGTDQYVRATPEGYLTGYAEGWVGVDLWVLRVLAGVRGAINFLTGGLSGEAVGQRVVTAQSGRRCVDFNFTTRLNASLSALSGHVLLFARGCVWWWGWHCSEMVFPLFSWNGIHWYHPIAQWSNSVRVGCY
jgi:hypothetical protein